MSDRCAKPYEHTEIDTNGNVVACRTIADLLRARGVTSDEIAQEFRTRTVQAGSWSGFLTGRGKPTIEKAKILADRFGMSWIVVFALAVTAWKEGR